VANRADVRKLAVAFDSAALAVLKATEYAEDACEEERPMAEVLLEITTSHYEMVKAVFMAAAQG